MRTAILLALALVAATPAAQAVEVVFERDASLPLVYINIAIKAGSVNDPAGQGGIANFTAEMLLRGSQSRTKEQIDLDLDQMGARLDAETRVESIVLRGAVLASQLDPFLKLVAELITQPAFPEHEIRKLKKEVESQLLEELGRDSTLAGRRFNKFLFQGHPYGKPVLGTVAEVQKLTRENLQAHYDHLFRDQSLLVLGTGDTDEPRIRTWADSLAEARPGGVAPEKAALPENGDALRMILIDKPDRTQTQIYGGQIGIRMTDERFFPLHLANHAFGGGSFSARMMVEVRVKRGWAYGANSYFRFGRQPRTWAFYTFPAAKDTPQALALVLGMVKDLREKGLTPEEFTFAQQSLVNSAGFMYNTPQKRVENRLLERTLDLPDGFMKSYGPELAKVTLSQANRALKDFLKPEKFAITVLGTAKDLKEPLAKAAGISPDKVSVVPYTQE